jgi:hypothetical protein
MRPQKVYHEMKSNTHEIPHFFIDTGSIILMRLNFFLTVDEVEHLWDPKKFIIRRSLTIMRPIKIINRGSILLMRSKKFYH